MTQKAENESWHLSKSVPVTLILFLAVQSAAVVWHGSQWTAAIHQNRTDIDRLAANQAAMSAASNDQAILLARIEENTRNLAERMADMVRQQDRQQRDRDQ